ncbi:hypothetical protein [Microcoleus sp. herbarium12]
MPKLSNTARIVHSLQYFDRPEAHSYGWQISRGNNLRTDRPRDLRRIR